MGGTILSRCEWNWKIFVATHKINDSRGKEFQKAIEKYKRIVNQELNYEFIEVMEDTQDVRKIVREDVYNRLNKLNLSGIDVIFTHNVDGEYHHINHKILGEYFRRQQKNGFNIWHFLCFGIRNPKEKIIGEYVETTFLDKEAFENKRSIFEYAYQSQHFLWEGFEDFMRFQFYSGLEMFTRY
jgi:hypothetical protein